jgi:hypothetical protein
MIDPKAIEAVRMAVEAEYLKIGFKLQPWAGDIVAATALTAYHKHLADNGSIVISVEWLNAVLAYASPIGVMGDHTFAEIRAMLAAAKGEV